MANERKKLILDLANGMDFAIEYPEIHFDEVMTIPAIADAIINYQEQGSDYPFTKENHKKWVHQN